jgi:hypothetical protein
MDAAARVAVVRNPFERFISSLLDHGNLKCASPSCALLAGARRLVRAYRSRRFEIALFPPAATIHRYTQSYFLSATDLDGRPIQWTQLYRLEEVSTLPYNMTLPRKNAKASYAHILRFLRNDSELRCGVCDVYRQDFACFQYTGCEGCA